MNKCNMTLKHSTIYAGNQKREKYLGGRGDRDGEHM